MFFIVLLPFTLCLANGSNESQPIPSAPPPMEFIWTPPTKPTPWPRHPYHPFHRKPWRPPPPHFFPTPYKYFPDYANWIPSRRTPSFPHLHLHHRPHHRTAPPDPSSPLQKFLNVPFEREDALKPPQNVTETLELDSQVLSTMEKLTSEKMQTKVEILKSIEMEYDPVLKRFVQKRSEVFVQPNHTKRSGSGLFTHRINQNLQDVFKKFQEEQQMNQSLVMRDKKNFQTGRFKFFKHDLVKNNSNNLTNNNKTMLQLICDVKKYGPERNSIPNYDRFSRNANFHEVEPTNDSISVYVDDPNFFNFLHGNWSKGGIPIMLTAMSSKN